MNHVTQSENDLAAEHEIKIQSTIKALTAQRESAMNALVNAQSEKAIAEHRLKLAQDQIKQAAEKYAKLETVATQKMQIETELRIVIANLQSQLPPPAEDSKTESADAELGDKTIPSVDSLSESVEVVADNETKSLLQRAKEAVKPILSKT